jgi:hypothetical protein
MAQKQTVFFSCLLVEVKEIRVGITAPDSPTEPLQCSAKQYLYLFSERFLPLCLSEPVLLNDRFRKRSFKQKRNGSHLAAGPRWASQHDVIVCIFLARRALHKQHIIRFGLQVSEANKRRSFAKTGSGQTHNMNF